MSTSIDPNDPILSSVAPSASSVQKFVQASLERKRGIGARRKNSIVNQIPRKIDRKTFRIAFYISYRFQVEQTHVEHTLFIIIIITTNH